MVERYKPGGVKPVYGQAFHRMVNNMGGPEQFEKLRQQTLRDQIEARAKWGAQPVETPRDRETYQGYPITKRPSASKEAVARSVKRMAAETIAKVEAQNQKSKRRKK